VPFFIELYKYAKIQYLSFKSCTPAGMIKYQLQEARYREYTAKGYYTDSVLAFFKSKYEFDAEVGGQHRTPSSDDSTYETNNFSNHSSMGVNNQLLLQSGILKLLSAPLNAKLHAEISEKMRRVAQAKHAPRNSAKDLVGEFIKCEIVPPCTCYHNQMARYIIKNQNTPGFGAQLSYIDFNGNPKKLNDADVLDISKRVMKAYDQSRVCDRTMKPKKCPVHKTL
jgi:hypothetical protein